MSGTSGNALARRPDSQQLVRHWALLRLLADATEPYSVKQLADQLGVSKATIECDLATLEHDFALVEENVGKQKKAYRIDHKIHALEAISFGTTELLAIYAAHAAIAGMAGTPLHDRARGRDRAAMLSAHLSRRGQGAERTHKARPLRLVWHRSTLYLLACLGEYQRITTLAVRRIHELEVLNEEFAVPRVDVDGHVSQAFGIFVSDREEEVEVLFDAEIAWKLEERTFHPSEQRARRPDGTLVYRVRSSTQWEIIPWVQSFGALAELVAPASWREAVRTNVEAMMVGSRAPTSPPGLSLRLAKLLGRERDGVVWIASTHIEGGAVRSLVDATCSRVSWLDVGESHLEA